MDGRCGGFACLASNLAAQRSQGLLRPALACRVLSRIQPPLCGPGTFRKTKNARELSTGFSCFDSTLRSVYGRCWMFAELVGKFMLRNANARGMHGAEGDTCSYTNLLIKQAGELQRPSMLRWAL